MNNCGTRVKWPPPLATLNSSNKASGSTAAAQNAHASATFRTSANSASSRKR